MTAHNDMVARVLKRHKISQVTLADEAQLSESTITRIIQGTRVLTPEVIRALWRLTRDPEIFATLSGAPNLTTIIYLGDDAQLTPAQTESLAVRACAKVLADHGAPSDSQRDAARRRSIIDEAITGLMALRARLGPASNTAASANPYRAVAHGAYAGRHLDISA